MRAKPGLHNVAALFVTSGARYSATAIRDLEILANYPERQFRGTALATVLDLGQPERLPDAAVYEPIDLTYSQLAAVRSALSEALTVITGPPGTGKSQVVTAILASAAAQGRTVLFASRNHAALDAVGPRLEELSPDRPLMIRLNRRWGDGSPVRISDLIKTFVARPVSASDGLRPDDQVLNLSTLDQERAVIMDRASALALDREAVAAMETELSQHLIALRLDSEQVVKLTAPSHAASCAQGRTGWIGRSFRLFVAKKHHQAAWEEYGCPAPNRARNSVSSQGEFEHWAVLGATVVPVASGDETGDVGDSAAARELDIAEDATHSPGSADRDIEQIATVAHEAERAGRHTRAEARADEDHVPRIPLEPVCGLCDQAPLIYQLGRERFGDLVGDPVRLLPEGRADTD